MSISNKIENDLVVNETNKSEVAQDNWELVQNK